MLILEVLSGYLPLEVSQSTAPLHLVSNLDLSEVYLPPRKYKFEIMNADAM